MAIWLPDDGLVEKTRMIGQPIITMSNEDRIWVVVNLSALGWTAQEIADRLSCSLRLIRNIKAEPAAQLATYALSLRMQVLAIAGTCRLEVSNLRLTLDAQNAQLEQIRRQRADLIAQLRVEGVARIEAPQLRSMIRVQAHELEQLRRQRADLIQQLQLERTLTPRRNIA